MSHVEGAFDLRLMNQDAALFDYDKERFGMASISGTYAEPRRMCPYAIRGLGPDADAVVPAALPEELHHFPICICEDCRKYYGPHDIARAVPVLRAAVGEDWAQWCYQFAMRQRPVEQGDAWKERREALDSVCRIAAPGEPARRAVVALLAGAPWCDYP